MRTPDDLIEEPIRRYLDELDLWKAPIEEAVEAIAERMVWEEREPKEPEPLPGWLKAELGPLPDATEDEIGEAMEALKPDDYEPHFSSNYIRYEFHKLIATGLSQREATRILLYRLPRLGSYETAKEWARKALKKILPRD